MAVSVQDYRHLWRLLDAVHCSISLYSIGAASLSLSALSTASLASYAAVPPPSTILWICLFSFINGTSAQIYEEQCSHSFVDFTMSRSLFIFLTLSMSVLCIWPRIFSFFAAMFNRSSLRIGPFRTTGHSNHVPVMITVSSSFIAAMLSRLSDWLCISYRLLFVCLWRCGTLNRLLRLLYRRFVILWTKCINSDFTSNFTGAVLRPSLLLFNRTIFIAMDTLYMLLSDSVQLVRCADKEYWWLDLSVAWGGELFNFQISNYTISFVLFCYENGREPKQYPNDTLSSWDC